jgi:hypothetical protein
MEEISPEEPPISFTSLMYWPLSAAEAWGIPEAATESGRVTQRRKIAVNLDIFIGYYWVDMDSTHLQIYKKACF